MTGPTDELRERVRALLAARAGKPVRLAELVMMLGLPPSDRRRMKRIMREMVEEGFVLRSRGHSYAAPLPRHETAGILRVSPRGFGFVVPDDSAITGENAAGVFVPQNAMGQALHGDRVKVRLVKVGGRSPEGTVIEVLERANAEVTGTYYATNRGGQVNPRNERLGRVVATGKPDPRLGVANGDLVVAKVTEWTPVSEPLMGEVVERLGAPGERGLSVTMVIRDAGVDPAFPAGALAEAAALAPGITTGEISRRLDLRDVATFTMDGPNAKDFDDALSVERTPDGLWQLGVHIADVAHYVAEGTALDREAFDRATSIYPVDRVVPMLPERLSNGLCSLKPREDRLTLSCLMEIDGAGRVHDYSIRQSIIRSAHRLTYEEVQELMDGQATPDAVLTIGDIRPQLEALYELRRVLTAMRLRRGALDLDVPETEVRLDAHGTPLAIERRPRLESHRVVEECMLIANEVVATHLFNLHIPSIFRIHEDPDTAKLRKLAPVLEHLGIRFPAKRDITPEAIQVALDRATELETGFIARRLILRAMMRAHYDDENQGHYGLASPCYTHFTSPIRRYPDLIVHRLLKECIVAGAPMDGVYSPPGEPTPDHGLAGSPRISLLAPPPLPHQRIAFLRSHMGEWARHCSEREQRAEEIEREATKVKVLEYMRQFLGDEFDGYVVAVLNWGFFVELVDIPVDGLVHVRNLEDDFFEYDDERMILVGKHTGETVKLGDRVRVALDVVNLVALEMDFALVRKYSGEKSKGEREERHRQKMAKAVRHAVRQPKFGGFQRRGGRRHK